MEKLRKIAPLLIQRSVVAVRYFLYGGHSKIANEYVANIAVSQMQAL
jgi:hypothetical protein